MPDIIKNIKAGEYTLSLLISLLTHSIVFIATSYLFSLKFDKPVINTVYLTFQKEDISQKNEVIEERDESEVLPQENISTAPADASVSLNKTQYDTSDIRQIYRESTLNVSVRYPNGWTYIDQNVKNKLDGVTFWAVRGNYEVPPYVHLEVQDKLIFNPSRYKHQLKHKENIFYFNDPEELEGYYSQIVYIRTDSEEDYSLKLMVKGKENFNYLQPVFFNMAKSFSFGKTIF